MAAYDRGAELAAKTHGETHSTTWVPAAQYAWTLHRNGHRERAQRALEASRRYDHPSTASIAQAEAAVRAAAMPDS